MDKFWIVLYSPQVTCRFYGTDSDIEKFKNIFTISLIQIGIDNTHYFNAIA